MQLLLISSSTVHGYAFLDHAEPFRRDFLQSGKRVVFAPFVELQPGSIDVLSGVAAPRRRGPH